MSSASVSLSEQESIDILQDLARNSSSATARIQAIKLLREIRSGETSPADGFATLYEVANPGRLKTKAS
jgi:hypothetical protein